VLSVLPYNTNNTVFVFLKYIFFTCDYVWYCSFGKPSHATRTGTSLETHMVSTCRCNFNVEAAHRRTCRSQKKKNVKSKVYFVQSLWFSVRTIGVYVMEKERKMMCIIVWRRAFFNAEDVFIPKMAHERIWLGSCSGALNKLSTASLHTIDIPQVFCIQQLLHRSVHLPGHSCIISCRHDGHVWSVFVDNVP